MSCNKWHRLTFSWAATELELGSINIFYHIAPKEFCHWIAWILKLLIWKLNASNMNLFINTVNVMLLNILQKEPTHFTKTKTQNGASNQNKTKLHMINLKFIFSCSCSCSVHNECVCAVHICVDAKSYLLKYYYYICALWAVSEPEWKNIWFKSHYHGKCDSHVTL